jgi:hypothetical protein
MSITYLDLTDLDNRISEYENRWNVQSIDMLKDERVRSRIPESVLLRWETFVRQRVMLRQNDIEVRSVYLSNIPKSTAENHLTSKELVDLAA